MTLLPPAPNAALNARPFGSFANCATSRGTSTAFPTMAVYPFPNFAFTQRAMKDTDPF